MTMGYVFSVSINMLKVKNFSSDQSCYLCYKYIFVILLKNSCFQYLRCGAKVALFDPGLKKYQLMLRSLVVCLYLSVIIINNLETAILLYFSPFKKYLRYKSSSLLFPKEVFCIPDSMGLTCPPMGLPNSPTLIFLRIK
jgi:hypothetical protein